VSDNWFRVADFAGGDGVSDSFGLRFLERLPENLSRAARAVRIRFLIAEVILVGVILVPSVRLFIVRQMLRKEFKLR